MTIRISNPVFVTPRDCEGVLILRLDAVSLDSYSGRETRAGSIGLLVRGTSDPGAAGARVIWLIGEQVEVVGLLLDAALNLLVDHADRLTIDGTPPGADAAMLAAALESQGFWVMRGSAGQLSAFRDIGRWGDIPVASGDQQPHEGTSDQAQRKGAKS